MLNITDSKLHTLLTHIISANIIKLIAVVNQALEIQVFKYKKIMIVLCNCYVVISASGEQLS